MAIKYLVHCSHSPPMNQKRQLGTGKCNLNQLEMDQRPNQILLECQLCDFRTTDGHSMHIHLTESHPSTLDD